MPKFHCSYAHDIACYRDFVVEASSHRAAQRLLNQALRQGRFANVHAEPCWENGPANERVFIQGETTKHVPSTTFAELIGDLHTFGATTRLCVRCNRHADDDALEHLPCRP